MKIFMEKKELFSLVKKSRKRAEAWKLKLLIQMKNEAQIFHKMVGNSMLHQGNERSSHLCSKLSCVHTRDTKILVETQMTDVEAEILQSHIRICDTSVVRLDN